MASSGATKLFLKIGMKIKEKIFQAKKRIKELQRLIAYWENAKQV